MNYMEREQFESDGIAKLILKHAGIVRQNYLVVIAMAIAGLVAGIIVQVSATDTFIKEVLLKNGNGLHLNVISNLIQPTSVLFSANNSLPVPTDKKGPSNQPSTNLTINNNEAKLLVFGEAPAEFKALNLQIVLRAASSKSGKIAAIKNLPEDSRLIQKGSQSETLMNEVIKRYKISSLKRGSDEIIVRFDGKSVEEAEAAVNSLVQNLRTQFAELERDRIVTAFKAKLLVINSQLKERENVLKSTSITAQGPVSAEELKRIISTDILMIALSSDKQKIANFAVEQVDIEPFIVVPIDLSKKVSFVSGKLWLVLATFAGLIFGLFLCYAMYGIGKLKED